ncbi:MAG: LicD family protein [Coriobacteriia bacterium]|nr:LicD family protein [Coriobacteriia bacterium]
MNQVQNNVYEVLKVFDELCTKNDIGYVLVFGTLLGAVRHKGFIPWDDDIDIAMLRSEYEKLKQVAHALPEGFVLQTHEQDPHYLFTMPKIRNTKQDLQEFGLSHMKIARGPWLDIFIYDAIPDANEEAQNFLHELSSLHKTMFLSAFVYPRPDDRGIKKLIKTLLFKRNKRRFFNTRVQKSLDKLYRKINDATLRYHDQETRRLAPLCFYEKPAHYLRDSLLRSDFTEIEYLPFEDHAFPVPKRFDEILSSFYGDYMTPVPPEQRKSLHIYEEKHE